MKNFMKNAGRLVCLMAYAVAGIGGAGNCCMNGEYVTAVCIAILAGMAWPTVYKLGRDIGS